MSSTLETLDVAFEHFSAAVLKAASLAGMPSKVFSSGSSRHAPFYDHECLLSKRRVQHAIRQGLGQECIRPREREYHHLVRSKRRLHKGRQLKQLLHTYGNDRRAFWKRLKGLGTQLPPALLDLTSWDAYLTNLCNLPPYGSPSVPANAFSVRPTAACDGLNSYITNEELILMLAKQHNGKASSCDGLFLSSFGMPGMFPLRKISIRHVC